MADTITVHKDVLRCLTAVATAALDDLQSGLDDGTYEEDAIGGYSGNTISACVSKAEAALAAPDPAPRSIGR